MSAYQVAPEGSLRLGALTFSERIGEIAWNIHRVCSLIVIGGLSAMIRRRMITLAFRATFLFALSSEMTLGQEKADWSADLETLYSAIREIHPAPYNQFSEAEFEAAIATLNRRLPTLSPHASVLEFQKILAMVGDGHTEWATLPKSLRGSWLPLIIRRFEEGWFVRTGDPRYMQLFGKPITHISGIPIHEATQRVLPYVAGENELGKLDEVGNLLRNVKVLDALGIAKGMSPSVTISVLDVNNNRTDVAVDVTEDSWVQPGWIDVDRLLRPNVPKPLYRKLDGNYACAWLPNDRVLYVKFDKVRDDEGIPIDQFFDRVYAFAQIKKPEKFVLDLRENSGGNLELNGPVLRGLVATTFLDRPGRFFVIIGPDTYSAAMNLAVLLERHTHALFVGAPTGASPNHFGDTRAVKLPHCGIDVEISELAWQNSDPRDVRPWITPDLPANPSAAMFIAGRDPALEAILAFEFTEALAHDFGSPMTRWRRANQQMKPDWPALLARNAQLLNVPEPQLATRIEIPRLIP